MKYHQNPQLPLAYKSVTTAYEFATFLQTPYSTLNDENDNDYMINSPKSSNLSFTNHSNHSLIHHSNHLQHLEINRKPPCSLRSLWGLINKKPPCSLRSLWGLIKFQKHRSSENKMSKQIKKCVYCN